jgi:hypothetical protein
VSFSFVKSLGHRIHTYSGCGHHTPATEAFGGNPVRECLNHHGHFTTIIIFLSELIFIFIFVLTLLRQNDEKHFILEIIIRWRHQIMPG